MKNEPVSIKMLLTPLNIAIAQKIWRQELRNPAISDLGEE
jgi:hypothetical protein